MPLRSGKYACNPNAANSRAQPICLYQEGREAWPHRTWMWINSCANGELGSRPGPHLGERDEGGLAGAGNFVGSLLDSAVGVGVYDCLQSGPAIACFQTRKEAYCSVLPNMQRSGGEVADILRSGLEVKTISCTMV